MNFLIVEIQQNISELSIYLLIFSKPKLIKNDAENQFEVEMIKILYDHGFLSTYSTVMLGEY
jgi:hypothetical protein